MFALFIQRQEEEQLKQSRPSKPPIQEVSLCKPLLQEVNLGSRSYRR
jgi:hypothetical protein